MQQTARQLRNEEQLRLPPTASDALWAWVDFEPSCKGIIRQFFYITAPGVA
jgi:hypothetical protein